MNIDKVYNTQEGFRIPPEHIPSYVDMQRLADGDSDVVDVLIEGLLGFVTGVVSSYIGTREAFKPHTEDLHCVGILALTEFINSKLGRPLITTTSFMSQIAGTIKIKINHWARDNEDTIHAPGRTQRRTGVKLVRHDLKDTHLISDVDHVFDSVWMDTFEDELTDEQSLIMRMMIDDKSVNKICEETGIHRSIVLCNLQEIERLFIGE